MRHRVFLVYDYFVQVLSSDINSISIYIDDYGKDAPII